MFTRGWPLLFWGSVALAAVGALALEWRRPPQLPAPAVVQAPETVVVPPLQLFQPSPLSRYAEVVERPIFIETRRPEAEEAPVLPEPPPVPEQSLTLIGVVLIPNTLPVALLRPEAPEVKAAPVRPGVRRDPRRNVSGQPRPVELSVNVLRVFQGGMVDDWRLETVQADKVVLRKGDEVQELALIRPSSPPLPAPPAKPTAQRASPAPPHAALPVPPQVAPPSAPPTPGS
ncbi:MAG TPA: hypothetical protein DCS21_12785 [Gammaproteobacteria bacterium]|nr:hypothetical protein [Gammaproteobacteria bacterium]